MNYTTYILYSKTIDRFYIGYSSNFPERLQYHNNPEKYRIWTKRGIPWEVFLTIDELEKSVSRKLELHLKRMESKKYIKHLKANPQLVKDLLTRMT